MIDESQWEHVTDLFERLVAGDDADATLASEPDPEVRLAVLNLWRHHVRADAENYLDRPMAFEVLPIFQAGQVVLNRFRIEKMLGSGGMGEVYLAWDERVEDRVALKTIARLLAPVPSIRKRFAAEVQGARRVTHPNVCRIHELFEDGETIFFSMEYVDGRILSDEPKDRLSPAEGRSVVLQMARGLQAAHQTGIVHGDFKPANVMITQDARSGDALRAVVMDFGLARALDRGGASGGESLSVRAGTVEYMAPELIAGAAPTIRSDIYAFGKVAAQVVSGERLWDECTKPRPEERPASLEKIIQRLEQGNSRRSWMGGVAIAAAAIALETIRPWGRTEVPLPVGARILVNGFRTLGGDLSATRLARSVLITGLQQSPRLQPIADQDLLPAVRLRELLVGMPLMGEALRQIMTQLRAAFWIDGDLHLVGGRYSLGLRLLMPSRPTPVAVSSLHDSPSVIALAQAAAVWVRQVAGESDRSLAANPPGVVTYTSEVPEALQKYYEALEHYALAEIGQAAALLEEAVQLDPRFAQAHNMLGVIRNASRQYDEGYREMELAMQLAESRKLPDRERTAIESRFYRATEDPFKMVEAARRNVSYHPTEPLGYTMLGRALVDTGNPRDGVDMLLKAVSMAPDDWVHILPLEDALVEAGQFSRAVDEYRAASARGVTNRWLHNGAAAAYMGLEQYEEAAREYQEEPPDASNSADQQGPKIMLGHLDVTIAAMQEQRARSRGPIESHQANEYLCALYFATDRPAEARRHLAEMADMPAYPTMARRLAGTASWARRLGDDATLANVRNTLGEIARRWPNPLTDAAETHATGLEAWRRNAFQQAEDLLLQSAGSAFGVWTIFDLAELFTWQRKLELAESYWEQFEARRGTLLVKLWCPAIMVYGWLYRAVAAQGRNDRTKAFQYSGKVLDHWAHSNPHLQIVRDAGKIHAVSHPL